MSNIFRNLVKYSLIIGPTLVFLLFYQNCTSNSEFGYSEGSGDGSGVILPASGQNTLDLTNSAQVTVVEGTPFSFQISSTYLSSISGTPTYTWRHENLNGTIRNVGTTSNTSYAGTGVLSAGTESFYSDTIANLSLDEGYYYIDVTKPDGTVDTLGPAQLNIIPALSVTGSNLNDINVNSTQPHAFNAVVSGPTNIQYQWYYTPADSIDRLALTSQTAPSLQLNPNMCDHRGSYELEVTSNEGGTSQQQIIGPAYLDVFNGQCSTTVTNDQGENEVIFPEDIVTHVNYILETDTDGTITNYPNGQIPVDHGGVNSPLYVLLGQILNLTADINYTENNNVTYQWYHQEQAVGEPNQINLTVNNFDYSNRGVYEFRAYYDNSVTNIDNSQNFLTLGAAFVDVQCLPGYRNVDGQCYEITKVCTDGISNGMGISTLLSDGNFSPCELNICFGGYQNVNGQCVAVSNTNTSVCTPANGQGVEINGSCVVTLCNNGYQNLNNTCVPNTCNFPFGLGAMNNNGVCTLSQCHQGFVKYQNSCVPEIQTCPFINGIGLTIATEQGPTECTLLKCLDGYVEENGSCTIANNNPNNVDPEVCAMVFSFYRNPASNMCVGASNSCVAADFEEMGYIKDTTCGQPQTCQQVTSQWLNPVNQSCHTALSSCDASVYQQLGFTLSPNCGQQQVCAANNGTGVIVNNICEINTCNPGFILNNGICTSQICTIPGGQGIFNSTNGQCENLQCLSGHSLINGECVSTVCQISNGFGVINTSGVCAPTSCNVGWSLVDDVCLKNTCATGQVLINGECQNPVVCADHQVMVDGECHDQSRSCVARNGLPGIQFLVKNPQHRCRARLANQQHLSCANVTINCEANSNHHCCRIQNITRANITCENVRITCEGMETHPCCDNNPDTDISDIMDQLNFQPRPRVCDSTRLYSRCRPLATPCPDGQSLINNICTAGCTDSQTMCNGSCYPTEQSCTTTDGTAGFSVFAPTVIGDQNVCTYSSCTVSTNPTVCTEDQFLFGNSCYDKQLKCKISDTIDGYQSFNPSIGAYGICVVETCPNNLSPNDSATSCICRENQITFNNECFDSVRACKISGSADGTQVFNSVTGMYSPCGGGLPNTTTGECDTNQLKIDRQCYDQNKACIHQTGVAGVLYFNPDTNLYSECCLEDELYHSGSCVERKRSCNRNQVQYYIPAIKSYSKCCKEGEIGINDTCEEMSKACEIITPAQGDEPESSITGVMEFNLNSFEYGMCCPDGQTEYNGSCMDKEIACVFDGGANGVQTLNMDNGNYSACYQPKICADTEVSFFGLCYDKEKACKLSNDTNGVQTFNEETGKYSICHCSADQGYINNECQDKVIACEITNGEGQQTWNEETKEYSNCSPVSCNSNFMVQNNSCVIRPTPSTTTNTTSAREREERSESRERSQLEEAAERCVIDGDEFRNRGNRNAKCSPLIMDFNSSKSLEAQGIILDPNNKRMFNIGGNRVNNKKYELSWLNGTSARRYGWLALPDENGEINGINELFGNNTEALDGMYYNNGYEVLAFHDDKSMTGYKNRTCKSEINKNGDCYITKEDTVYSKLKVWVDANANAVAEPNEVRSLESMNVVLIDLSYNENFTTIYDKEGNATAFQSIFMVKRVMGLKS